MSSGGEPVEAVLTSGGETEEPGSLSGTVSNASAEGIEGVTVEICEEEEEPPVCRSVQSGAGGHYSILNVLPGFYVLTTTPPAHSGYGAARSEEFEVLSGEAATDDVQLRAAGSVSGEITSQTGSPLAGVPVELCEEEFGLCFTATTEAAGDYSFAEVPPGEYQLTASPAANSGYGRGSARFLLAEGQAATENLKLPEAGSVTGTVTDQHNSPQNEAVVDVCMEDRCYQAQTNSSGEYTIEGVADGTEYVATVAPSYTYDSATSSRFPVSGRATSTVNLTVVAPVGPPPGTEMPGTTTLPLGNVQVPLFYWHDQAPLTTTACVGGHVTATATGTNTQNLEVQTSSPATLHESSSGSGHFKWLAAGTVPRPRSANDQDPHRRLPAALRRRNERIQRLRGPQRGGRGWQPRRRTGVRRNGHAAGRPAELRPVHGGAERLDGDVAGEPQELRHRGLARRIRLGHAAGLV